MIKLTELVNSRWFKTVVGLLFVITMLCIVGAIAATHQGMISALPMEMRKALSLTFVLSMVAGFALNQAYTGFLDMVDVWFNSEENKGATAPSGGEA